MIDIIFMQIVVISHKVLYRTIKLVKIFCFKLFKINLNIFLKTIIFDICNYVLIELLYYILIENDIGNYLNVYAIVKEDF